MIQFGKGGVHYLAIVLGLLFFVLLVSGFIGFDNSGELRFGPPSITARPPFIGEIESTDYLVGNFFGKIIFWKTFSDAESHLFWREAGSSDEFNDCESTPPRYPGTLHTCPLINEINGRPSPGTYEFYIEAKDINKKYLEDNNSNYYQFEVLGNLSEAGITKIADFPNNQFIYSDYSSDGFDFDNDNNREFILKENVNVNLARFHFYEAQGDNIFAPVASFDVPVSAAGYYAKLSDIDDSDGDSLKELLITGVIPSQMISYHKIYESTSESSYPSQLSWEISYPSGQDYALDGAIDDLDNDGKKEVISVRSLHGSDNFVTIYENTGDNSYQEVYEENFRFNQYNEQIGAFDTCNDLDNDGKKEFIIAGGGLYGEPDLRVIENTGDNSYQEVYRTPLVEKSGQFAVPKFLKCLGDVDNDGKKEFIIGALTSGGGIWGYDVYYIFEANGDNSFTREDLIRGGPSNNNFGGLGDVVISDLNNDESDDLNSIQYGTYLYSFEKTKEKGYFSSFGHNIFTGGLPIGGLSGSIASADHDKDGKDEFLFGEFVGDNERIVIYES